MLGVLLAQSSYGFIQSSERNARFFFHFSQYNNNVATMKIGGVYFGIKLELICNENKQDIM